MEDEDEHALQGVEDGEQVGHDHRALVDVHQAERPGEAQQAEQGDGSDHPGPATHTNTHLSTHSQSITCFKPGLQEAEHSVPIQHCVRINEG